ncbi:hypothetical protein SJI19_13430 [Acerihabitans sp. TG2]|uniref:hypothetical protein n=1 Tax=Acerihabitans sp. TG2 TaxID=3096008 RepID=UPI002B23D784|nr:hypothetical protein [Acerihabitans sp. TG2]MEA9391531.1 hypothetical protein [Acerihabitans sp. TG2]
MDKINSPSLSANPMTPAPCSSTADPGNNVLSDGLTHVGNRPFSLSLDSIPRTTTSSGVNHDEIVLSPITTDISENQADMSLFKREKDQINRATQQSVCQSAPSRFGTLYPKLDIKTDANIINHISDLSIAEDVVLEDAENDFKKNIVISLPNRSGMSFSFSNLTVYINNKISESMALKNLRVEMITKYLFSADQYHQYSEKIIIPSGYFKNGKTAGIVLSHIIEAANDYIYAQIHNPVCKKNETDKYPAKEQIFAIALSVYRLVDFLKTKNNPAFPAADINKIMQGFPEIIHLGWTIERHRPLSAILS